MAFGETPLLDRVRETVAEHLDAEETDQAMALVRGSVELLDEGEGAGYWGGRPELPAEVPWPRDGEAPLSLVATLDCSVMAELAGDAWSLPGSGRLLFFKTDLCLSDGGRSREPGRVIHVPGADPRRQPPADLPAAAVYPESSFGARRRLQFPSYMAYDMTNIDLVDLMDAERAAEQVLGVAGEDQVLGWWPADRGGRRCLLNLGTPPGADWGELVAVSFWITPADLAAGRLDDVTVGDEVA